MNQKILYTLKIITVILQLIIITTDGLPQHSDLDYYVPPKYKFDYSVHDPESGDVKSHWESREGDAVIGAYTVHDPDGVIRVVEYTADPDNGFNAHVSKQDGGGGGYEPSYDSFK
ncbi:hypothetical protein PGB90_002559 [Kerria lacca]